MLTTVLREGREHGSRHKLSRRKPVRRLDGRPPGEKQGVRPKTYSWKVREQTCECLA